MLSVACVPGTERERLLHNPDGPAEWAATGIDVEVEWGVTGPIIATGKRFAAPVVAGHLARIRCAHPHIAPWRARTVLAAWAGVAGTAEPHARNPR